MPDPAGTGLDRRQFLLRGRGPGDVGLRHRPARRRGLRGGIAAAARASPCSSTCSWPAGRTSLSRPGAPGGHAGTARCARRLGLDAGTGTTFAEDPQPALAPVGGRARDAARRGQGVGVARRSATTIPTSRTSPAATSGRSASCTGGNEGLAGPLPRRRRRPATTRCRGCPGRRAWRRRWLPAACRWPRSPSPRTTLLGRGHVGDPSPRRCSSLRAAWAPAGGSDALGPRAGRGADRRVRRALRAASTTAGDPVAGHLPDRGGDLPDGWRRSPRCSPAGCRSAACRSRRPAGTTRTPTRRAACPTT